MQKANQRELTGFSNQQIKGLSMADINSKLLHELFEYRDGILYWKKPNKYSKMKPGDKAGRIVTDGHLQTCVNGIRLYNHRIIFMMFYGYFPEEIDHIDCNPLNNQISNLRPATKAENLKNRRIPKNNKSGIKGIHLQKNGKWLAVCGHNKKANYLGTYDTMEKAANVVKSFREQHHGEFARHQ